MLETIFLCAGGTGGHVFPAVSMYCELQKKNFNPIIITDKRCVNYLSNQGVNYLVLPATNPSGGIPKKIIYLGSIMLSCLVAAKLIIQKRPKVLIGFGGYPSFPAMFTGIFFFRRIIIHEQNSILGKANRIIARFAEKIATSYRDVKGLDKKYSKKTFLTGNPVRKEIIDVGNFPYPEFKDKLNLFVTGGSQGSRIFSIIIPQAIKMLPEEYKKMIHIEQQCRKAEIEDVRKTYKQENIDAEVKEFFTDMPERLRRAHLCICRSGASTLSELAAAGRPAIFVPLASAKFNHQEINARLFVENNSSQMILEKDFSKERLVNVISDAISNFDKIKTQAHNIRQFCNPDAVQKIIDLI